MSELLRQLEAGLRTNHVSFPIVAAVLFGSAAKGQAGPHSDIDLLVVGDELPRPRHRRARQIVEIKRLFPGTPVDVLLLTREETQSNFSNHNPLFLDVAEDGIVVLDRGDMLADAMRATRAYVRARGIVRTPTGWRFPVAPGVATAL